MALYRLEARRFAIEHPNYPPPPEVDDLSPAYLDDLLSLPDA